MRIRITTTDQVFTAVLDDSETTRDFASLLPIKVTLEDYGATNKQGPCWDHRASHLD